MRKLQSCAILSILLLSVGCGSDEFSTYDADTDNTKGIQNSDNASGGSGNNDTSSDRSGTGGSVTSTGGSVTSTGGGASTGGSTFVPCKGEECDQCVPVTCEEISITTTHEIDDGVSRDVCGSYNDGCGGTISCSCEIPGEYCGAENAPRFSQTFVNIRTITAREDLCGDVCHEQKTLSENYCPNDKKLYICYDNSNLTNCEDAQLGVVFGMEWCCD